MTGFRITRPLSYLVLENLKRIRGAGGVGFLARDLRDMLRELSTHERTT